MQKDTKQNACLKNNFGETKLLYDTLQNCLAFWRRNCQDVVTCHSLARQKCV